MKFSKFLASRKDSAKKLVEILGKSYQEVSILGTQVFSTNYVTTKNTTSISSSKDEECGFVVKLNNGKAFYEYSTNDILDVDFIVNKVKDEFTFNNSELESMIEVKPLNDEKLVKAFSRDTDFDKYTDDDIIKYTKNLTDEICKKDEKIVNVNVRINKMEVSKFFVSKTKELDQAYGWAVGAMMVMVKENGKISRARKSVDRQYLKDVMAELSGKIDETVKLANKLAFAKMITPGVYDIITDPSITGLIAHEAFGHGVEIDQFVKDRALAKSYVNKYVASEIVNMKDGAASVLGLPSYFFDDNGVLAHDTQIIKDGILVSGISDEVSARELNTSPTGNGRREAFSHKAYTRMTSTFIEKGKDKLEDMIKSIKHGFMLFETNNGMEDPKNWSIQCVCEYGIEIIDGKLTDNYYSPVVISGNVLDLLKSISMVSDDFEMSGSGMCGKGYKEWVRVADGGPCLKAKVKLS